MGRIEKIWLKRAHRGPMDPVLEATLVVGHGVEHSVGRSKRRQVTILEAERWQEALDEIGAYADPRGRRANVLVSGISLTETRGRVLQIGGARVTIGGETTPCERMDEVTPGLRVALQPHWRAGAFGQVTNGGVIRVGDDVSWIEEPALLQS